MRPSAQADFLGCKTTLNSSLIIDGFCWLPYYTNIIDGLQTSINCGVQPNGTNARLANGITLNFHTSNMNDSAISTLRFSGYCSRASSIDYDINNYKIRFSIPQGIWAGHLYCFGSMSS
jgi:hypothetical protein